MREDSENSWLLIGAVALVIAGGVVLSIHLEAGDASNVVVPVVSTEPVAPRPDWVSWVAMDANSAGSSDPLRTAYSEAIAEADRTFTESDWRYVRTLLNRDLVAQACAAARGSNGYGTPALGAACERTQDLLQSWMGGDTSSASQDGLCADLAIIEASAEQHMDNAQAERELVEYGSTYYAAMTAREAACSDASNIEAAAAMATASRKLATLPLETLPERTGTLIETVFEAGRAESSRQNLQALVQALSTRLSQKQAESMAS